MKIECSIPKDDPDTWAVVPLNYAVGFLALGEGDYTKAEVRTLLAAGETLERAGFKFRKSSNDTIPVLHSGSSNQT